MKKTILTLIICGLLTFTVSGQTGSQQNSQQTPANIQQSALADADKLNAQVLKLCGERQFDLALPLAEHVLVIREKELGPDSKPVALALTNLGAIYFSVAKNEKSEDAYQRALNIYEKIGEANSADAARILDSLAFLSYRLDHTSKTETLYLQALAIREKLFGHESADVALDLYSLALFYNATHDYKKAGQYFQQLIEVEGKLPESEQQAYPDLKMRYACTLRKEGKSDEARKVETGDSEVAPAGSNTGQVAAGVINGKAISLPKPTYPAAAKKAHVDGDVSVQVLINEVGQVIFACAIDGNPLLHAASEYAAMSARFTPTTLSGKPVKVTGVIGYHFVAR